MPRGLKTEVVPSLQGGSKGLELKRIHALERIICIMDLHETVRWRELEQVALPKTESCAKNTQEGANVVCAGVRKCATPVQTLTAARQIRPTRPDVSNNDQKRCASTNDEHDVVMHFLAP
jgi:hypothetical protein